MPTQPYQRFLSRRKALAGIGASGVLFAQLGAQQASAQSDSNASISNKEMQKESHLNVAAMKANEMATDGTLAETDGFHQPGDGGGALYRIEPNTKADAANGADVIELNNGFVAVLQERTAVNYQMFGALGDGIHDDGVQIKLAHRYAERHQIPVVNLSGDYWILQTNEIPITTNVYWGKTRLHVDERFNSRRSPRFIVRNDESRQTLKLDADFKAALLARIKPGVQIIPELAEYAGHLISVVDDQDRIGIRAGESYSKRGWAREELFYVEEEGRIIGDIAWTFNDLTSVTATPCNDNYLVIEGGGLYFSGDTPEDGSPGYHQMGISIQRSRTIIREQWVGLEKGKRDTSTEPRSGIYSLNSVYDVTLENIRALPWEKNRRDKSKAVAHGTYGIGGARMLNCTFRNLTAEAGSVAWGVFGTNLNKHFRVENCRLNRIDVHFHCWNLHIRDCSIGFKGITVTGGGDLLIENTTCDANSFVNFRRDYGAKWDGRIRLSGCTLRPTGRYTTAVLSYHPQDFDYKYPIGYGREICIENMLIDYGAVPDSQSSCWLLDIVSFAKTKDNTRLFFPERIELRNVRVAGREQGVRIMRIADPYHFQLTKEGSYDGSRLCANCTIVCDNLQLEEMNLEDSSDPSQTHLAIGSASGPQYADQTALYPNIRFTDCNNVCICMANCCASLFVERCHVNSVAADQLRGELAFSDCHLLPHFRQVNSTFYQVRSKLGTRFTNCTIHAPVVNDEPKPELIDHTGILAINRNVFHSHLNTRLSITIQNYLNEKGIILAPEFIEQLKAHYEI